MHRNGIDLTKKDPKVALQEDLEALANRHNLLIFGFAGLQAQGSREMLEVMPAETPMTLHGFAHSWFEALSEDERNALADAFKAILRLQLKAKGLA